MFVYRLIRMSIWVAGWGLYAVHEYYVTILIDILSH